MLPVHELCMLIFCVTEVIKVEPNITEFSGKGYEVILLFSHKFKAFGLE